MKIEIRIPMSEYDETTKQKVLDHTSEKFGDKYDINESEDDDIHFGQLDTEDDRFLVILNVSGMTRFDAQEHAYKCMQELKYAYSDCEFVIIPSKTQESRVIPLTNTKRVIDCTFNGCVKYVLKNLDFHFLYILKK